MKREQRVLTALQKVRRASTAELRKITGVFHVSNVIFQLREQGHKIYTIQNQHGCFYEYVS
jgi:hypothetical protein